MTNNKWSPDFGRQAPVSQEFNVESPPGLRQDLGIRYWSLVIGHLSSDVAILSGAVQVGRDSVGDFPGV